MARTTHDLSDVQWGALVEAWGGCAYCGSVGPALQRDCVLAISRGWLPPTINLEHPDPECDLDYIPLRARQVRPRTAMANGFGFGGQNSVIVFKEFAE